jgi:pimeloyl-ACP methyl ester carboxylesterase
MDGTGKLFDPIINLLPKTIDTEVIPLSSLKDGDAKSQAYEIAERLGEGQYVIFAESYSGTIAYQLCQNSSLNIKHVIFAASFLSRPSYISKFGYLAPVSIIRFNLVPKFFLSWLFFGSLGRIDLVKLFLVSLQLVSNTTLKNRLKNIASLSEPNKIIQTPCTYIQANKDKLVSKKAVAPFKKLCVNLRIKQIKGGHFIAQSNPQKCVEVICAEFSL